MMVLGLQETADDFPRLLESAPTLEIMIILIVLIVAVLAMSIAWFVTKTIRVIRITSINAGLAERLVNQGIPCDEVERIVSANQRFLFPSFRMPTKWKRPKSPTPPIVGKPARRQTTA